MRVLRKLHRRMPHGSADVQSRVRYAQKSNLGGGESGSHGYDLSVLWRGVHANCSRAGWENSARHFAARSFGNERPSMYQGTVRYAVCPDSRERTLDTFRLRFRFLRYVEFISLVQCRRNLCLRLVDQFLPAINQVISALP